MEQNTALLVMDMQSSILGGFPAAAGLIEQVNKAIAAARSKNIPVMFVVVGFRNGTPEVSPNNKSFSAIKERYGNINMDDFLKIDPAVNTQPGDITVTKRRVSAFAGSDLEVVLRAQGIQHMVLTGIATSGVVLSTLREASDKDYKLTVIADCCADGDEEVHRVLTTKIFPRQAEVTTVADWAK